MHFQPAEASSLYIKPAIEMPIHNVDEEPRVDLIPVLNAVDRFGQTGGYAGALMRYYYPSSFWWEWSWKDSRPLEAAQDFGSMRIARG
jgi:hypothetical protein